MVIQTPIKQEMNECPDMDFRTCTSKEPQQKYLLTTVNKNSQGTEPSLTGSLPTLSGN